MINFTVFEDSELKSKFEPGRYRFKIVNAQDMVSKAGNIMIKIELEVWNESQRHLTCFDYLLPNLQSMAWKFKHLLESVGLDEEYNKGILNLELLKNKIGFVELVFEEKNEKNYLKPKDYLFIKDDTHPTVASNQQDTEFNDEIPF